MAMTTHQIPQSVSCSLVVFQFLGALSGARRGTGVGDTDTEAGSVSTPRSREDWMYSKSNSPFKLPRGTSRRKGGDASTQKQQRTCPGWF
jgi:hypothetical protein